jgi:hypothetical protein
MRLFCLIGLGLILRPGAALAQDKKVSAAETASRRLAELLTPGRESGNDGMPKGPIPRRSPGSLENPEVPLPVFKGTPPHLSLPGLKQAKPGNPPEEAPLSRFRSDPVKPEFVELPAGPLVRLPSIDVEQPIPLPILAQPHRDRASLADPTLEASVAAALAPVTVARTAPMPFTPLNLPDPFENSQAIRLRYTPDELPTPPPITPRTPKK